MAMSGRGRVVTSTAMSSDSDAVSVVVGRFDPLVHRGLLEALGEDPRIRILDPELGLNQQYEPFEPSWVWRSL
jgi:hypothetical protein